MRALEEQLGYSAGNISTDENSMFLNRGSI